jgi:adenine phosphoribosyltransferase
MKQYLRRIDTNTTGNRNDVTPLFAHPADFDALVADLAASVADTPVDLVAAMDSLGFILGTAIAQKLNVGILAVRKGGKLPVEVDRIEFSDYTGLTKQLEIRRDILSPGQRVLIVDEWIETGAQISAAITLIEGRGAIVAGIATINMDDNEKTRQIGSKYRVWSTWSDSGDS